MTPEGKIKAAMKKELDRIGAYYFLPQAGIYGRSGIPDIVGHHKGVFFAIECKDGNRPLTELQKHELERIEKLGGLTFVARDDATIMTAVASLIRK